MENKDKEELEVTVKLAKPDSLAFRAKFSQQRRKDRKKKNSDSGLLPNERP